MQRHLRLLLALVCVAALAGAGAAGALAGGGRHHHWLHRGHHHREGGPQPADQLVSQVEAALGAQGTVSEGVLSVDLDRTDIGNVTIGGVPIKPSFEVNGQLNFQSLGGRDALLNGDLALKPSEINPVIDAILANGLTFQAEHQHMYDFSPMVWFIHLRGEGDAVKLAQAAHNVIRATSTPLPQSPPQNPTTPLDQQRLQGILHGSSADVGEDGVVTVYVPRRDPVYIDGILVNPRANISTSVSFEPLDAAGKQAAAIPDFALEAAEVNPVMATMRSLGWDVGCLYNQETNEHPQLYFSHQFKTGDPYQLAREIRAGLDRTNSQ